MYLVSFSTYSNSINIAMYHPIYDNGYIFINFKWHYETVCLRLLPIFVVRKAADNSEFFIFNNNNWWMWSKWWLWLVSFYLFFHCYTKCIWMSSIKNPWFNVFYAVLKVNHSTGFGFICYMGNRNNTVNANIYLYLYG